MLLDDHQVLTTGQVTHVLFRSQATCAGRLRYLRRLGFIDRFLHHQPGAPGATVHWVPGLLSARYAALSRDQHPPTLKALRERQDRVVASPTLNHLIGTNQFFVDLLAGSRAEPHLHLARWWSEIRTARTFGSRIHPDGHGIWADGDHSVGFWLEHDTGTEPLRRLVDKLDAYARLQQEAGPVYPVLFWLPNQTRERHLHQRLAAVPNRGLIIATASRDAAATPLDAVWRVVGKAGHRQRLGELPSNDGQPGPYNPGPPTPEQDPLRLTVD